MTPLTEAGSPSTYVYGVAHHGGVAVMSHAAAAARQATDYLGAIGLYATAQSQSQVMLHACQQVLGPEHPDTLAAQHNLAGWTGRAGDPAAARDQLVALLPRWEQVYGPEHPSTLLVQDNLAGWTRQAERHQKR